MLVMSVNFSIGKPTLLKHLAWWWQRTGLVDEAFLFSNEERA